MFSVPAAISRGGAPPVVFSHYITALFDTDNETLTNAQVLGVNQGVYNGGLQVYDNFGSSYIENHRLRISGNNVWDSQYVISPTAYPKANGLTMLFSHTAGLSTPTMIWGGNTAATVNSSLSNSSSAFYISGGSTMRVRGHGHSNNRGGVIAIIAYMATHDKARLAMVHGGYDANGIPAVPGDDPQNFVHGQSYFMDEGAGWRLVYRIYNDFTQDLYPYISNYAISLGETDYFKLYGNIDPILPVFLDTFTDTDNVEIRNHTPDYDVTGQGWSYLTGGSHTIIVNNMGQSPTSNLSTVIDSTAMDPGIADTFTEVWFNFDGCTTDASLILYLRFNSTSDCVRVKVFNDGVDSVLEVRDYKHTGGNNIVFSETIPAANLIGDICLKVQLVKEFMRITVEAANNAEYTYDTINNTNYKFSRNNGTRIGLGTVNYSATNRVKFDKFAVYPAGTKGEYSHIDHHPPPNTADAYKMEVTTTASSKTISLSLVSGQAGNYDFNVDWGDGTNHDITTWDDVNQSHTYSTVGTFIITVTGACTVMRFNNDPTGKLLITDIIQWGNIGLNNLHAMFYGCTGLVDVTAKDGAGLSGVRNLSNAFRDCTNLSSIDVTNWDMSSCTNYYAAFFDCSGLHYVWGAETLLRPGSTTIQYMFYGCSYLYNISVSGWDMSSVTVAYGAFTNCANLLELDLAGWDTSSLQNAQNLFYNCNKVGIFEIKDWDVSSLTVGTNMMFGVGMRKEDYDPTLVNWSAQTVNPDVTIHFGTNAKYSETAARAVLTGAPNNWIITDGGPG